jgi:hypothetical protein
MDPRRISLGISRFKDKEVPTHRGNKGGDFHRELSCHFTLRFKCGEGGVDNREDETLTLP